MCMCHENLMTSMNQWYSNLKFLCSGTQGLKLILFLSMKCSHKVLRVSERRMFAMRAIEILFPMLWLEQR